MRLTISASASGSSEPKNGFAKRSAAQASRSSSHSVAPAGLGYMATVCAGDAGVKEEGEADGDPERCPDLVGHLEAVEPQRPGAGRAHVGVAAAKRETALTRAENLALGQLQHVAMIGGDDVAAEIAVLLERVGCAVPRDRRHWRR